MKKVLLSAIFACLFTVAPSAHAAVFTDSQVTSLLGLLSAFGVPQGTIDTVHSIIGSNSSGESTFDPFAPGARISYVSHHTRSSNSTSDPSPESYVARAVHFDDEAILLGLIGVGASVNSPVGAFSQWVKVSASNGQTLFTTTGDDSPPPTDNTKSYIAVGYNSPTSIDFGLETLYGGNVGTASDDQTIVDVWAHLFVSWDYSDPENYIHTILLNGVRVDNSDFDYIQPVGDGAGDTVVWSSEAPYGSETSGYLGFPDLNVVSSGPPPVPADYADLQMWIGTYIAPTPENVAKFIADGKPVNPATAQTAFGAPQIRFSGDASANGYRKNTGTYGDIFSLAGGTITDAASSPSD